MSLLMIVAGGIAIVARTLRQPAVLGALENTGDSEPMNEEEDQKPEGREYDLSRDREASRPNWSNGRRRVLAQRFCAVAASQWVSSLLVFFVRHRRLFHLGVAMVVEWHQARACIATSSPIPCCTAWCSTSISTASSIRIA